MDPNKPHGLPPMPSVAPGSFIPTGMAQHQGPSGAPVANLQQAKHLSAGQTETKPYTVLYLGKIPTGTDKRYVEWIFTPYGAHQVDMVMKKDGGYAFIHFPHIGNATQAKLALEQMEIFPDHGRCTLKWRHENRPASRPATPAETGTMSHPMPASGPMPGLPQNNQPIIASSHGGPTHETPQMQYRQPLRGGYPHVPQSQTGHGSPPLPPLCPTQHWQPQAASQRSRPQTPSFGSIRGPSPVQAQSSPYGYPQPGTSPVTSGHSRGSSYGYSQPEASSMAPTQGYSGPYGYAQPTPSVSGGGSANQMQWSHTGTPGSIHQLGHFQSAVPQPQSAGSPSAYHVQSGSPPGVCQYQSASTGAYHPHSAAYGSHGFAAQAPSSGYSPQVASYGTSGYGTTVQADTIPADTVKADTVKAPPATTNPLQTSTQPALQPQLGLPPCPVKTLEPLAHSGVRSATGVSQLPSLNPGKQVGQPLHQSRTTAAPSASSKGLFASSADTLPTSSPKEKPKRAHTQPSSATAPTFKANSSSSPSIVKTNPSFTKAPATSSKPFSIAPSAATIKAASSTTASAITKPSPILVSNQSQRDLAVVALHASSAVTTDKLSSRMDKMNVQEEEVVAACDVEMSDAPATDTAKVASKEEPKTTFAAPTPAEKGKGKAVTIDGVTDVDAASIAKGKGKAPASPEDIEPMFNVTKKKSRKRARHAAQASAAPSAARPATTSSSAATTASSGESPAAAASASGASTVPESSPWYPWASQAEYEEAASKVPRSSPWYPFTTQAEYEAAEERMMKRPFSEGRVGGDATARETVEAVLRMLEREAEATSPFSDLMRDYNSRS